MITILGDSIQKRVLVDGVWYICNLSHRDNIEYWSVANAKKLAEFLTINGYEVVGIDDAGLPERVQVDKSLFNFQGEVYHLNQCEDLIEWTQASVVGEFTNYYDKVCFHTDNGFVAAYRDDINNFWSF